MKETTNEQKKESPLNQSPVEPVEQEAPFYNVMPKSEGQAGPIVAPKIQVTQDSENPVLAENQIMTFIKRHKNLAIIILAVSLLAYPAYYLFNKYVFMRGRTENTLTDEALKKLEGMAGQPSKPQALPYKTPADWQLRFFDNEKCDDLNKCGDEADPDRDGLKNIDEFKMGTDPNNADSDGDGLADGDEVYIFDSSPLNKFTAGDEKYNDGDYIKGGYNPKNKDLKYSVGEIYDISAKMKSAGLHEPTLKTLNDSLMNIYKFPGVASGLPNATPTDQTPINAASSTLAGLDQTPEAKQDRDTQRSNSLKNIAIALTKYYTDNKAYPKTLNFSEMFAAIKPYIKVATNPVDPINKDKYVYAYAAAADGQDFILSFFSETQNQIIRARAADAKKYSEQEQAALYDDQRKNNLETLRTALLLYASNNAGGNQAYVFPQETELQTALVPKFIGEIPKDPKTNELYEYKVAETFDSFTLKAILDAPPAGRSGYLCNQEECRNY